MKTKTFYAILFIAIFGISGVMAQNVDEIVNKHIDAIGGKAIIDQLKTAYIENIIEIQGNESPSKISIINGKGYKMVADVMGSQMVTCYTDSFGWNINPMAGVEEPAPLPADQYKMGKDQIYIADPLVDYAKKGIKLELLGQEMIGAVNAYKIKIMNSLNAETVVYIDPATYYIIQTSVKMDMMGQEMTVTVKSSDFKKTDIGYVLAYTSEANYGDQFSLTTKIAKIEINKDIDPAIFKMGK